MKQLCLLGLIITSLISCSVKEDHQQNKEKRPNFLLIITDDQSWPHTGYENSPELKTPNIDRIAKEGFTFNKAYAPAPTCTASRSGILSGQHIWRTDAGSTLWGEYPSTLLNYQQLLEESGYQIGYTGKGWGPGLNKTSLPDPAGRAYNTQTQKNPPGISTFDYVAGFKKFMRYRDAEKPFSFWVGFFEPHRPYHNGAGKKNNINPEKLIVPGFLEDHSIVRSDIADYLYEINWLDNQLGEILKALATAGELDNTVIVFTSDNGMPFPRAKSNNYEYGVHVPLTIRFGKNHQGIQITHPVSLTDIAPTFLELANITIPTAITGRSLASEITTPNLPTNIIRYVYTGFNRHILTARPNNAGYPVRAIHSIEHAYIHNFSSNLYPSGNPPDYKDIDNTSPSKDYMFNTPTSSDRFPNSLSINKRPSEELYNIKKDPYQLTNLANDSYYDDIKNKLKKQLFTELKKTNDPLLSKGNSIYNDYPYHAP